jgi:hypothetical protein
MQVRWWLEKISPAGPEAFGAGLLSLSLSLLRPSGYDGQARTKVLKLTPIGGCRVAAQLNGGAIGAPGATQSVPRYFRSEPGNRIYRFRFPRENRWQD